MTKPLHVGHCARNGLFAALLAREDYTANTQAFEHKQVSSMSSTVPGRTTRRDVRGMGEPFDIERPGLGIKLYPAAAARMPRSTA